MTTTRTVRDDQHGTKTGYTYGCRCKACTQAARIERQGLERQASESLRSRVLDILRREADMDDIAIVGTVEIGQELGVTQPHASAALHDLCEDKLIKIEGRSKFNIPVVRLLGGAA